jgi:tRNA A37 methylthiotransferase MiaB
MVGFPSETDEDFQQTIDAIQEIKFDDIVVFKYSGVAGTDSFNMEHQVAEKNKELRLERLWNELPFLRYFLELENNKLWIIDKKKALKIRAAVNIYSTPID